MLIQDLLLAGTPEQAALITRNATFTYAEMSEKVAAARTKLAESGVKKGDRVLFGKYSGDDILIDGAKHKILKESEILAVYEKE